MAELLAANPRTLLDNQGLYVHTGEYRNMITRMPEWVVDEFTLCQGGAAPY
jgi:hypothetical protein